MPDFFDNLIDNFSFKDLRTRVRAVIAAGLVIIFAAGVGLYFLAKRPQLIEFAASAQWIDEGQIKVQISSNEVQMILNRPEIDAEILNPPTGIVNAKLKIVSLDPAASILILDGAALPTDLHRLTRMDIKLIVLDKPFWQLLW